MTLQLPDRRVGWTPVTEIQGSPPVPDELAVGRPHRATDPDRSLIVESPMPTMQTQEEQGGTTHLVLVTLLGALVVCAFVGVPLALFVHGLTGHSLIAVATAVVVLTVLIGGVVRGLRATTRRVPSDVRQSRPCVAASEDGVAPRAEGARISLPDLMARDPLVATGDRRLLHDSEGGGKNPA